MDEPLPSTNNVAVEIEKEYREFLAKLDLLKEQQEELIKEYREKLEQRKLSQLREQLNAK
jgi:hypothetical protein